MVWGFFWRGWGLWIDEVDAVWGGGGGCGVGIGGWFCRREVDCFEGWGVGLGMLGDRCGWCLRLIVR